MEHNATRRYRTESIKEFLKVNDERLIFSLSFLLEILFGLVLIAKYGSIIYHVDSFGYLYHARIAMDNGVSSGLSSLVGTWLPFFQLLLVPFVLIDKLYVTGFSGTVVSALMTAGASVLLYRLMGGKSNRFAILAPVIFLSNIYTLIYGAITMSEQTAVFFLLLICYFFKNYLNTGELRQFIHCSIALILGSLVRYEIWVVAVFVVSVFLITEIKKHNLHKIGYAHLPVLGILSWLFMNYIIHKDAFWFNNNLSSNKIQAQIFPKYFYGSDYLTIRHALIQMDITFGAVLYLAIISVVLIIITNRAKNLIPLIIFFIPSATNVILMLNEQSMGWQRFFYVSIPGIVILIVYFFENLVLILGYGVNVIKGIKGIYPKKHGHVNHRMAFSIVVIMVIISGMTSAVQSNQTADEKTEYVSIPDRPWIFQGLDMTVDRLALEIVNKKEINKNDVDFGYSDSRLYEDYHEMKIAIGNEKVLMPSFSINGVTQVFSVTQAISPDQIIDGYDYRDYDKIMSEPWNYVEFVAFSTADNNDLIKNYDETNYIYKYNNNQSWRTEFLDRYMPVLEGENVKLFQLKEKGRGEN